MLEIAMPSLSISFPTVLLLFPLALTAPDSAGGRSPLLSLENAIKRALANSHTLAAARASVDAARGRLIQAGARINPVFSVDAENLSGSGGEEVTFRGEQVIELGGKRGARSALARAELSVAGQSADAERTVVRAEVRALYAQAQAAHAAVEIARQSVRIAEDVTSAVARKVEAGAVSPAESARATVELANARLELLGAEVERGKSEARLATLWSARSLEGSVLSAIPDLLHAPPSRDTLATLALEAPGVRATRDRVEAARKNLALQRSLAMPNLQVGGGVRSGPSDERTFVAGVSLPLPIFDRNAGNEAAAAAELSQADALYAQAARERLLELDEAMAELGRARARRHSLRDEVLPAATAAYEAVLAGYLRGRFDYVDVLESRRSLVAAARAELDAYLAYTDAAARIERIAGVTSLEPKE